MVSIITNNTDEGRHVLRHSTAHVLAQAVTQLYPGTKFTIGPAIENGFYYDFDLPNGKTFNDDDLAVIEKQMKEIVKQNQPFTRSEHTMAEAKELFADQPYKVEIIERVESIQQKGGAADSEDAGEISGDGLISAYRNTDDFVGHVCGATRAQHWQAPVSSSCSASPARTGVVTRRVRNSNVSTARHGSQSRRLPITSTSSKRRSSAITARSLSNKTCSASPAKLGGGLAVWHPKGAIIRKLMEDYSRQRHENGGYDFVYSPHLANANLFETSGHLDFYADGMYPPMEMDNGTYYPKPMNCPMHCLIFDSRQRSYRELPLRLFELGTVYRYERAGTLHGLMRIRGFTQDDSHIYCTEEQLAGEVAGAARLRTVRLACLWFRRIHVQPVDA